MNFWYDVVCWFMKTIGRLWLRTKVQGVDLSSLSQQGPLIVAPNHASYIDPPLIAYSWWPVRLDFFASRHLFERPILKHLMTRVRAHPVDRAQGIHALRQAVKLLQEGKMIVIFPEGTRSRDGNLGSVKKGISMLSEKGNSPVVPVWIEGSYDVWPPHKKFPKIFVKKNVVVHIGAPLEPCPAGEEAYAAWLEKLKNAYIALQKECRDQSQG